MLVTYPETPPSDFFGLVSPNEYNEGSTSPLPAPDLSAFPEPHAAQQQVLTEAGRFNVVVCGRRWGKTELGKRLLGESAMQGERAAYLAPTFAMALQCYRELVEALHPMIVRRIDNQRIELDTGGVVDIWSMEGGADRVRGQRYHLVVMDECAMVAGLIAMWDRVVRPTLADYRGSAWFLSTPRRGGGFQELYERRDEGWRSWRMPTSTNPFIDPMEIAAARAGMSEQAYLQEFEADFEASESDLVYVLDREKTIRTAQVPWAECHWRVVGIDPGGGDPTAIVPLGVTRAMPLTKPEGMSEFGALHWFAHQYGEFYRRGDVTIEMIDAYLRKLNSAGRLDRVLVGETGGNVLTNTLVRLGWPAQRADMRRGEGIETVRWLLEQGRLTIEPDCRESIAEFPGYRWNRQRDMETGERFATSTPGDNHADAMDARRYAAVGVVQLLPRGERSVKVGWSR